MANFCDYMVQHVLYVTRVERSIREATVFPHKEPTECAFGKMFYSSLKPNLGTYPEEKRQLIEHMEEIHNQFHASAKNIHPDNPEMEQHKRDAWYYSSKLINMLDKLERMPD